MNLKHFLALCVAVAGSVSAYAQNLYVGANFHPHDYDNQQEIDQRIRLMEEAGFNVVRMGHLAWDSFEPADGDFRFEWFDKVMDSMHKAGIRVILDIPVRPAPMWVHEACPGTTIVTFQGDTLQPLHRYFNDVGDRGYQKYARRLAGEICRRYAGHPALMAFGIDNEPGDGSISYSKDVRQRFISWLKNRYGSVENLNDAWAGWRWSRMLNSFDQVVLPDLDNAGYGGNAERQLDFRRFLSDEILDFYTSVIGVVNGCAPGVPTFTNAWYYSGKYFDYADLSYKGLMTYGGCGFYPGTALDTYYGMRGAAFGIQRIQFEQNTPHWCAEFTTMNAAPGTCRKQAYMSLMYTNQMVCGWTLESMWGGEEQYLEGMLDWDGVPNYKYHEYARIAQEFSKIAPWFPYRPDYEVAIALDFASTALGRMNGYPVKPHENQAQACFDWFYDHNTDVRIIDPVRSDLEYKLVIIPGMTCIPADVAEKLRRYIHEGGTVIMTSRSAMTDGNGKVLKNTQPGGLDDVFGIRVAGTYDLADGRRIDALESRGATVLESDSFYGTQVPIATEHRYGKGRAVYLGFSADSPKMAGYIDAYMQKLGLRRGPQMPQWVSARMIDGNHILLLNHSNEDKTISLSGRSILSGKTYGGTYTLKANDADFIEIQEESRNTAYVDVKDKPETIIAKAVTTVPSARQVAAMENEFIAFVHFGPNTFTGMEWGSGKEDPAVFDLHNLDTDQWCRAMKAAGMKTAIITAKHHDGFVLWQSRYTSHGVMSSPYRDGRGDVVAELAQSCRKYGIRLGIYLSPADLYQMEAADGLYGNGSKASMRSIPRAVEGRPFANKTTFNFEVDDYNEYFLNQLFELLTEYGPIDEVWFDGAHPRRKGGQQYDYASWRRLIRTLVPDAVVFGREDIRWCGNEAGATRDQEWNVICYSQNPDSLDVYNDITDPVLGTRDVLLAQQKPFYLHYQPAETDTSIRDGWFWRNDDEQQVRSADDVFDIYERSVGGNAIFLLNIPPNTDGRFSDRDVDVLEEVGRRIRDTYGADLMEPAAKRSEFELHSEAEVLINRVMLCEPVAKTGERVEEYAIDALVDEGGTQQWRQVYAGTNIGRKHIARFAAVKTSAIRVRVLASRAPAHLSGLSAHYFPAS